MTVWADLRRLGIPPQGDYVRLYQEYLGACQGIAWAHDPHARRKRTEMAFQIGDYGRAIEDARWLTSRNPLDPGAHLLHGKACLGAAASELLQLPASPGLPLPAAASPRPLLDEAAAAFGRVLEANPSQPHARLGQEVAKVLREQELESPPTPQI